jgi:alpha-ketoglutaric semialdehyde dehydrogenase
VTALSGSLWLQGRPVPGRGAPFRAVAAASGEVLEPAFRDASADDVDAAASAAAAAAPAFAAQTRAARSALLRGIADGIVGIGEQLLERAGAETALPRARLETERARTVNQLRLFADLVADGSWVDARIDRAQPSRQPVPRPDLRAMLVPLGPVAVFGSSNFPLAYSVAGGDTASALAAGCPVVVKAHPAHPGTSELVARAVGGAVAAAGLPAGVFAMLHGQGHDVCRALVQHPAIAAVGFTGSPAGGRALCELAAARQRPIPVFAEMGSVNPVFVLASALAQRGAQIGEQLAASALLAAGQFCTSPGMVLFDAEGGSALEQQLATRLGKAPAGTMVHATVRGNFDRALALVGALGGVQTRAAAPAGGTACAATAAASVLFATDAAAVLAHARLREEIFGPAVVVVRCRGIDDMLAVALALDGHLTATVHGTDADLAAHRELLSVLQRKVGRLIWNGVPTGVEVCTAMQHGGPWPASSDPRFTAVGPRAVLRWARPVCFQDMPPGALPEELRDGNPAGIWRTVDGVVGRH